MVFEKSTRSHKWNFIGDDMGLSKVNQHYILESIDFMNGYLMEGDNYR